MTAEVYQFECHTCGEKSEVPAGEPGEPEQIHCPRCGTALLVDRRPRVDGQKTATGNIF